MIDIIPIYICTDIFGKHILSIYDIFLYRHSHIACPYNYQQNGKNPFNDEPFLLEKAPPGKCTINYGGNDYADTSGDKEKLVHY